jgi:hypothetical protein
MTRKRDSRNLLRSPLTLRGRFERRLLRPDYIGTRNDIGMEKRLATTAGERALRQVAKATCDTRSLLLIAVCAATNLAIGIRNGLQLT